MTRWRGDSEVPVSRDIEGANTLPARYYTDPDVFERERESVFLDTWQYVGDVGRVDEPGSFLTREIAGNGVVVTRDRDGDLRAFHNVCAHRGSRVVDEEEGETRLFQCPYHGWTYDLDGDLHSAPNFDDDSKLDCERNGLQSVAVETWGPMVFVNLSTDPDPLAETLGGLQERFDRFALEEFERVDGYEYEIDCNWKVYVDNYIECDHCDLNHASSLWEWVHPDSLEIEPVEDYVFIDATLKDEHRTSDDVPDAVADRYHAAWIWPNVNVDVAQDDMEVGRLKPLGPERMVLVADRYRRGGDAGEDWESEAGGGMQVLEEDAELCERQQEGLASAAFSQGRLGPNEHAVHHFQRLVQDRLNV